MKINPVRVIEAKRDGLSLSDGLLNEFVQSYAQGEVAEYQMSAFAMAVYFQGLDEKETESLTRAMLNSGSRLEWPDDDVPRVDKHSTGGVGDKVSLALAPLLACCGLQVPMISGRGLGATGGTLDKLESIPGYRTQLDQMEIQALTRSVGCVICGATSDLAPADRKLYALRDVTGTVPSVPLITASIMSKKLAESLDALVLDVKFGSGAFMKSEVDARRLAESLVAVGRAMEVPTSALLSDMNQPLGNMAGNAVEVLESLETLKGEGPEDLTELTISLGIELLALSGQADDVEAARTQLHDHLSSGRAYEKFGEMVRAQGGDSEAELEVAPARPFLATKSGFLDHVDTERLGQAIIHLGGGRRRLDDPIDHAVGLRIHVRLADRVEAGQPLLDVHSRSPIHSDVQRLLEEAFTIGHQPREAPPLLAGRIES